MDPYRKWFRTVSQPTFPLATILVWKPESPNIIYSLISATAAVLKGDASQTGSAKEI